MFRFIAAIAYAQHTEVVANCKCRLVDPTSESLLTNDDKYFVTGRNLIEISWYTLVKKQPRLAVFFPNSLNEILNQAVMSIS